MTGHLQRALDVAPTAMRPGLRERALPSLLTAAFLAALVAMAADLGFTPEALARGAGRLGRFLATTFPPSDGGELPRIVRALAETFAMAFAGTVLAALVALPLGVVGAKSVVAQPLLHFVFRRALDIFRGEVELEFPAKS